MNDEGTARREENEQRCPTTRGDSLTESSRKTDKRRTKRRGERFEPQADASRHYLESRCPYDPRALEIGGDITEGNSGNYDQQRGNGRREGGGKRPEKKRRRILQSYSATRRWARNRRRASLAVTPRRDRKARPLASSLTSIRDGETHVRAVCASTSRGSQEGERNGR